jgi:probable HAF family extracellular repeat protein
MNALKFHLLPLLVCAAIASAAGAEPAPRYQVMDLTPLVGPAASAVAINNDGIAVIATTRGSALVDTDSLTVIQEFPDGARAINDGGAVAGITFDSPTSAWLWNGSERIVLPSLGGSSTWALGLNNRGDVTGYGIVEQTLHGYVFATQTGETQDLGTLGGPHSAGFAINSRGDVTGWAMLPTREQHAFRFSKGQMEDLGTLGGSQSYGFAIDSRGRVAGSSEVPGSRFYPRRAFVHDGTQMIDLGTLPGRVASYAEAMNDRDEIVGYSESDGLINGHAVLWRGGEIFDLNDAAPSIEGFVLQEALAINNRGQILVEAFRRETFEYRVVLLVPVGQ